MKFCISAKRKHGFENQLIGNKGKNILKILPDWKLILRVIIKMVSGGKEWYMASLCYEENSQ